jgi:DNA-binding response OmpR family regulator
MAMRLLLAEDDPALRDVLCRGLREAGYVVDAAVDGEEAVDFLAVNEYALCILDWRMPKRSGLEVLTFLRERRIEAPVLMLTARDAGPDRVEALDSGADDYLIKPFGYPELLARLRALLRRSAGDRQPLLSCGSLVLDPADRRVTLGGEPLELTMRELAILELLLRRAPVAVSRRSIALQAWPEEADAVGSNTIEVHIARIRAKIGSDGARLETVRGFGYRLVAP